MKVNTSRFGEIEIQPEDIFTFPHGLPGFEQIREYVIIQHSETAPFSFLQSVGQDGDSLSFIITNPFIFHPDYEFELPRHISEELKVGQDSEVMTWSIVSVGERLEQATINLIAPLIVNVPKKLGKQIILHDSNYKTKHSLMQHQVDPAQRAEG